MGIKTFLVLAAVCLVGCQSGGMKTPDGGLKPRTLTNEGEAWLPYVGKDGANGGPNMGSPVGVFLAKIGERVAASQLEPARKQALMTAIEGLKTQKFQGHDDKQSYLIIAIAERHSGTGKWDAVEARLIAPLEGQPTPNWNEGYMPLGLDYNRSVEVLLNEIQARFPNNQAVLDMVGLRRQGPHAQTNEHTSWARVLKAAETENAEQCAAELDHPETTTRVK